MVIKHVYHKLVVVRQVFSRYILCSIKRFPDANPPIKDMLSRPRCRRQKTHPELHMNIKATKREKQTPNTTNTPDPRFFSVAPLPFEENGSAVHINPTVIENQNSTVLNEFACEW